MIRITNTTRPATRAFSSIGRFFAKNDASTIDLFKLPSQTSINEWEFKYDLMPKISGPKIPPVSPEAVKQDIAQARKEQIEKELLNKELHASFKVEANHNSVVHGGESVSAEPEFLHDHGLSPVDASTHRARQSKKIANTHKYVQLSLNPEINKPTVVNLGHENKVDHKTATVEVPPEVEDAETPTGKALSSINPAAVLGLFGLGGAAGYYLMNDAKKPAHK